MAGPKPRIPRPQPPTFKGIDLANAGKAIVRNPHAHRATLERLSLNEAKELVRDLHRTEREDLLPYMGFMDDEAAQILDAYSTVELPEPTKSNIEPGTKREEYNQTSQEATILAHWRNMRLDRISTTDLGDNLARAAREQLRDPSEPQTNGYARAFRSLFLGNKKDKTQAMGIRQAALDAGLSPEEFAEAFGSERAQRLPTDRDASPADSDVPPPPRKKLRSDYKMPPSEVYGPKVGKRVSPEATAKNTTRDLYGPIQQVNDANMVAELAGLKPLTMSLPGDTTSLGPASVRALQKESTIYNKIEKLEERKARLIEEKSLPEDDPRVQKINAQIGELVDNITDRVRTGTVETEGAVSGLEPVPARPWWKILDDTVKFVEDVRRKGGKAGLNTTAIKRGKTPIIQTLRFDPREGARVLETLPKNPTDADRYTLSPGVLEAIRNMTAPLQEMPVQGKYVPPMLRTNWGQGTRNYMLGGQEGRILAQNKSDMTKAGELLERLLERTYRQVPPEIQAYLQTPAGQRRSKEFLNLIDETASRGELLPLDYLLSTHRANVLHDPSTGGPLRLSPLPDEQLGDVMSAAHMVSDSNLDSLRELISISRPIYERLPPLGRAAEFDGVNFAASPMQRLLNEFMQSGMSQEEAFQRLSPENWDLRFHKKPYGKAKRELFDYNDPEMQVYPDTPDMTDQSSVLRPKRLLSALMV